MKQKYKSPYLERGSWSFELRGMGWDTYLGREDGDDDDDDDDDDDLGWNKTKH